MQSLEQFIVNNNVLESYKESVKRLTGFYKLIATLKVNDKYIEYNDYFSSISRSHFNKFINRFISSPFSVINNSLIRDLSDDLDYLLLDIVDYLFIKKLNNNKIDYFLRSENHSFIKRILKNTDGVINEAFNDDLDYLIKSNQSLFNNDNSLVSILVNLEEFVNNKVINYSKKKFLLKDDSFRSAFYDFITNIQSPFFNKLVDLVNNDSSLKALKSDYYSLVNNLFSGLPVDCSKFNLMNYKISKKQIKRAHNLLSNKRVIINSLIKINKHLNIDLINEIISSVKMIDSSSSYEQLISFKGLIKQFDGLELVLSKEQSSDLLVSDSFVAKPRNEIRLFYDSYSVDANLIRLFYNTDDGGKVVGEVYFKQKSINKFRIGGLYNVNDSDWKAKVTQIIVDYFNLNRNKVHLYWN